MAAFQNFCLKFYGSEASQDLVGSEDIDDPSLWKAVLKQNDNQIFGLFHRDQLVGTTSIVFNGGHASFTGSFIDPDYRGRGLADLLYDVRKRHLKETGFTGVVKTEIAESNSPSLKAARRNGFHDVAVKRVSLRPDADQYHILELD